ncbi:MAG TPA: DUF475 domain-containing protein [Candidatus Saccharimonadales bacterium]|nr:DUF475 domain-containing protein [Candidatus Saccharimonadales bacterium]
MTTKSSPSLVRSFWFPATLTVLILAFVGILSGVAALFICFVLVILEVTFSFDNAVVNAKVLEHMSPFWQKLFLTVGIFIAVFVVRFALPIFIVQLTTGLGFLEVADLAITDPAQYGRELTAAGPMIEAFGGTFLLMIALSYFFDNEKDIHWLPFERQLAAVGRFDNIGIGVMLAAAVAIYFTVSPDERSVVFVAAVLGLLLHIVLDLFDSFFEKELEEDEHGGVKVKVGMAAFSSFLYLEVLDASFSFDGVIGAFAITISVLLIVAGLAAGAVWVRSMTVHLVRTKTLGKFAYLENGAFWAILALGVVMLLKLYHIELPEVVTGSIGLTFIGASVWWSVREAKKHKKNGERELITV